jgi:CTP:molybdopterin cytidylyltransferase MocA
VLPVAGLVLAAGGGRRIGVPKALLRLDGQLLVERAVAVLREAGCAPVVVVLGAGADRVRAEADLGNAVVVENGEWATGLGSSLRAGLAALADTPADAAVVLLVDTPGVTAEAVRRVAALPYRQALVCATYQGRRGHPMLFGRAHWSGISTLAKVDVGARPYLLAHAGEVLDVNCEGVATDDDIDTADVAAGWGIEVPSGVGADAPDERGTPATGVARVGTIGPSAAALGPPFSPPVPQRAASAVTPGSPAPVSSGPPEPPPVSPPDPPVPPGPPPVSPGSPVPPGPPPVSPGSPVPPGPPSSSGPPVSPGSPPSSGPPVSPASSVTPVSPGAAWAPVSPAGPALDRLAGLPGRPAGSPSAPPSASPGSPARPLSWSDAPTMGIPRTTAPTIAPTTAPTIAPTIAPPAMPATVPGTVPTTGPATAAASPVEGGLAPRPPFGPGAEPSAPAHAERGHIGVP